MKNIQHQTLNLPSEAPVMVLPGALLFPHALLPLYIFEPRYRAMLEYSLERDRIFCIAAPLGDGDSAADPEDFHDVAGVGLVRACVGRQDGTSHLILQGLARVRFHRFVQDKPFRVAQLQELSSRPAPATEAELLKAELLEACATLDSVMIPERDKLDEQLAEIDDPSVLSDVVAHTFLRDPSHRQEALDTLNVSDRIRLILSRLREQSL